MRSITHRGYYLQPGAILSLPAAFDAACYTLLQCFCDKLQRIGRHIFEHLFTFNYRRFFSATGKLFKVVLTHKPVFPRVFGALNHFPDVGSNSGKIPGISCKQLSHRQIGHKTIIVRLVGRVVGHKVKYCCLNKQYGYTKNYVTSSYSVYNFRRKVKHGLKHPERKVFSLGRFPQNTQIEKIKKPTERHNPNRGFFAVVPSHLTGFPFIPVKANSGIYWATFPVLECPCPERTRRHLLLNNDTTNIKQFLNYQGVVIEKSGRKTGQKWFKSERLNNVFTGGLSRYTNLCNLQKIFCNHSKQRLQGNDFLKTGKKTGKFLC